MHPTLWDNCMVKAHLTGALGSIPWLTIQEPYLQPFLPYAQDPIGVESDNSQYDGEGES